MFIGLIIFICTIIITMFNQGDEGIIKAIESIFRTSLVSIFGYFMSSKIKIKSKISDSHDRSDCNDEISKYNYSEGNLIQILLASFICVICIAVILIAYLFDITHNIAALSQFRDLMCTSIGFLLGESKLKKN